MKRMLFGTLPIRRHRSSEALSAPEAGLVTRCAPNPVTSRNLIAIKLMGRPATLPMLLLGIFWISGSLFNTRAEAVSPDYAEPKLLRSSIYSMGQPRELLFKSERRASRSGSEIHVSCDYTYTNGSLAAREQITYQVGELVSFEEDKLQTHEKGSAVIRVDPKNAARRRIYFEHVTGQGTETKKVNKSEVLEKDTLVDDMIGEFIAAHWSELENGSAAKFRYIALSRAETIGFKLLKDGEMGWRGIPAVRIKMVPTSFIIARLVDPVLFVVEKNGSHRVIEYKGRTAPLIREGNKWKDLDAVCVFHWDQL